MLLIGQLHYETTSKYNFPQILKEAEFSKKIVELSLNTMHTIKGKIFQLEDIDLLESFIEARLDNNPINIKGKIISTFLTPLKPIFDGTPIIGIDVSSIKIGTTEAGAIYAVRGAIVLKVNGRYRYLRFGPLPFHVTGENIYEIFKELSKDFLLNSRSPQVEPQKRLCNLVERWLQAQVSHLAKDSIILWDGSLTAGVSKSSSADLSKILKTARENSNIVMAFSKDTTLRFLDQRITDLVARYESPCLFEIDSLPLSPQNFMRLLGRVYVAKLAKRGCAFRLDIDRTISREESIVAVEKLLGNDIVYQGYPETLRLAHIYSTFTAGDVIGIGRFLVRRYGLRLIPKYNMHRTLFGPYGTRLGD